MHHCGCGFAAPCNLCNLRIFNLCHLSFAELRAMSTPMPDSIKIAVLDDYQRNAESFANWSSLEPAAKTVFFHDNVSDINQLATRLEPFSAVVLIRERTRFGADLIGRLPNLKLILNIGMHNAAIDLEGGKPRNSVVGAPKGL